jgi:hypothetical protein
MCISVVDYLTARRTEAGEWQAARDVPLLRFLFPSEKLWSE